MTESPAERATDVVPERSVREVVPVVEMNPPAVIWKSSPPVVVTKASVVLPALTESAEAEVKICSVAVPMLPESVERERDGVSSNVPGAWVMFPEPSASRLMEVVPVILAPTFMEPFEPEAVERSTTLAERVPAVDIEPSAVTSREVPAEDELRVTSPVTEAEAEVPALSVRKSASVLVMVTEPVVAEAERSAVEMSEPVAA